MNVQKELIFISLKRLEEKELILLCGRNERKEAQVMKKEH